MRRMIVSFGGVGLLPGMPGTYASFVAALLFCILYVALGMTGCLIIAAATLPVTVIGYLLGDEAEKDFGKKDPSSFVLDEVLGQWLTLLLVFLFSLLWKPLCAQPVAHVAVGFLLFRAFDIAKPWPMRSIETLPGGAGIMLDDVVAGLYAAVSMTGMIWLVRAVIGSGVYDSTELFSRAWSALPLT